MSYVFNPFTGNLDQTSSTSPGGSDTQLQFNDGGAFAGAAGLTWNKTTKTLSIASGALTASAPAWDISQTWNAGSTVFTGLKLNVTDTASSASSLLMDLQVGGATQTLIYKDGALAGKNSSYYYNANVMSVYGALKVGTGINNCGILVGNTADIRACIAPENNDLQFITNSSGAVCWTSVVSSVTHSDFRTAIDLKLNRDAAQTLAQRNGTNAQESRIYATYTSASNYQRCGIKTAKTTLSNVTGASVTASSLIPAGAFLIGVTSRINTALGTGNGTTGYTVGTAGDADLWGAITGTAAGVASGSANYTAAGASGLFTSATDVIVTATGGNFDGTGVIELAIHYFLTEAD